MNAMETQRHTANGNWINVVLGIWVVISPFVLTFARTEAALWNNVATGLAVMLVALSRGFGNPQGGRVLNILLGIWLVLSPFVLAVYAPVFLWNNIILGVIIALFALGFREPVEIHSA